MEQTECSETSAYKIQTPGNYLEEKHTTYKTRRKFEIKVLRYHLYKCNAIVSAIHYSLPPRLIRFPF